MGDITNPPGDGVPTSSAEVKRWVRYAVMLAFVYVSVQLAKIGGGSVVNFLRNAWGMFQSVQANNSGETLPDVGEGDFL